jgi:alpha-D-xyloside xylohydrolase
LTGAVVDDPGWVQETHDVMSLPLMVRPNSVIAVSSNDMRPDYDYGQGVMLQAYKLANDTHITIVLPSINGDVATTFEIRRDG